MLQRRAPLKRRSEVRERTKDVPRRDFPRHEQFVRGFACLLYGKAGHVCEGKTQFAHLRKGTDGGEAMKPSAWWGTPMCDAAHKLQHQIGEPEFERRFGVKLKKIALDLAAMTAIKDPAFREAMEAAKAREPWLWEV